MDMPGLEYVLGPCEDSGCTSPMSPGASCVSRTGRVAPSATQGTAYEHQLQAQPMKSERLVFKGTLQSSHLHPLIALI
jgi:hypothetical protein